MKYSLFFALVAASFFNGCEEETATGTGGNASSSAGAIVPECKESSDCPTPIGGSTACKYGECVSGKCQQTKLADGTECVDAVGHGVCLSGICSSNNAPCFYPYDCEVQATGTCLSRAAGKVCFQPGERYCTAICPDGATCDDNCMVTQ